MSDGISRRTALKDAATGAAALAVSAAPPAIPASGEHRKPRLRTLIPTK